METAIAVARALGDPATLLVATGDHFPDAAAAAAAAAHIDAAVLLTPNEQRHPATDAYLDSRETATVYAVGGPAARPYPEATPLFGAAREHTAVAVAEQFFDSPQVIGLARRDLFPDALTGGAHIGARGGPMLLTPTTTLHQQTRAWLCAHAPSLATGYVYGGTAAITGTTADTARTALTGGDC